MPVYKRHIAGVWTNRRELERLEVVSRNRDIDAENDRKALQRLQGVKGVRRYENDLLPDAGWME